MFVHESKELVALLMEVDLDRQIPPALYRAIAELLAWLYYIESAQATGQDHPPAPDTARLLPPPALRLEQMQAITEAEIENWHDYEVESRREIVALLRQIAEKNQLVRLLIKGEADVCVTSLLHVDPDSGTVVLDRSINREQNERIVSAPAR